MCHDVAFQAEQARRQAEALRRMEEERQRRANAGVRDAIATAGTKLEVQDAIRNAARNTDTVDLGGGPSLNDQLLKTYRDAWKDMQEDLAGDADTAPTEYVTTFLKAKRDLTRLEKEAAEQPGAGATAELIKRYEQLMADAVALPPIGTHATPADVATMVAVKHAQRASAPVGTPAPTEPTEQVIEKERVIVRAKA